MHELKAIIFDMDGTLADTEDIHRLAFNQAFAEFDFLATATGANRVGVN